MEASVLMTFSERIRIYRAARTLVIPERPPIYLDRFGEEYDYRKGSKAHKYCKGCKSFLNLSRFNSIHKGLYTSVLCKVCLTRKHYDSYEYDISISKVYRKLINKLRYVTGISSLSEDDIPDELIEMEKQRIILKTKINGKNKQGH